MAFLLMLKVNGKGMKFVVSSMKCKKKKLREYIELLEEFLEKLVASSL